MEKFVFQKLTKKLMKSKTNKQIQMLNNVSKSLYTVDYCIEIRNARSIPLQIKKDKAF